MKRDEVIERLRELALSMATAKAMAEMLRVLNQPYAEAEADYQTCVREFDAALEAWIVF